MSAMVQLSVDWGNCAGETYRFDGPGEFVVGRARDCDIQVPDTSDFKDVSFHHCALRMEPPKIWMNVYESHAGTFVNHLKVSPTVGQIRLYDGDEVQVGKVRLSIHIVEHDAADSFHLVGAASNGLDTRE